MNDNSSGEWKVIGETLIKNDPVPTKDTTKIAGIYGLKNKTTGKWYIGQSFDIVSRWNAAYKNLRCSGQKKIYNSLKKYGYGNFDKIIIEECQPVPWILNYREMYWIRKMDSINRGYNITLGGASGRRGIKMSDEAKMKIGLFNKGKTLSAETKEKLSSAKKGKPLSEKHRLALIGIVRKKRKSVPCSEEKREKLKLARLGKKSSKETRDKLSVIYNNRKESYKMEINKKISQKLSGRISPMKGKSHTNESKEKIKNTIKTYHENKSCL